MRELTVGELRYIDESVNPWKMQIHSKIENIEELPESVFQRMADLEKEFKDRFYEFYKKAVDEGTTLDSDQLLKQFEESFVKDHPEFWDMEALLA